MACICCSDSLKDLNPRKCSECITNLDSTICRDCLPELLHINCGDCSSSLDSSFSDSSSDAKYSCNLFLQSCKIFEQPKVNCRIKHADLDIYCVKHWLEGQPARIERYIEKGHVYGHKDSRFVLVSVKTGKFE